MDVLNEAIYKNYSKRSRYQDFPIYFNNLDQKYVQGIVTHLDKTTSYTWYTVRQFDTLNSISLFYYSNPNYYWIIADFNDILDPFEELIEGSKLKIPVFSEVSFV